LTYRARPKRDPGAAGAHPNTIHGVAGIVFVAMDPEARAIRWRDVLRPGAPVVQTGTGFEVVIGPHRAEWMTPAAYRSALRLDWEPAPHSFGEMAALRLLAEDLGIAKKMLEAAGRRVASTTVDGTDALIVTPDTRDGFAFVIQHCPIDAWRLQRTAGAS
jgi:hypothetical protein